MSFLGMSPAYQGQVIPCRDLTDAPPWKIRLFEHIVASIVLSRSPSERRHTVPLSMETVELLWDEFFAPKEVEHADA